MRTVKHDLFYGHSMSVTVQHNGFKGGDYSHHGFVTVVLEPDRSFCFEANGERTQRIEFTARGDWERIALLAALEMVVAELQDHKHLRLDAD